MGEWQQGDLYYNTYCNNGGFIQDRDSAKRFNYVGSVNDLRIPQPLDPECSGRCLDMMIKQDHWIVKTTYSDGVEYELCCVDGERYKADNPYTALLKALIEQEGL
jgi:hypothetical protein